MTSVLIDCETFLSENEHWTRLDQAWGSPVDLETDEEINPPNLQSFFSTFDLGRPTFDSAIFLRERHANIIKSPKAALDYKDFLQDLDQENQMNQTTTKQFYFVGGQIISAVSVDEICHDIDDVFRSVEKLYATTSTIRVKKKVKSAPRIPDIVECSFSTSNLSFDETEDEKEKCESVDRYIDELFDRLDVTMASLQKSADVSLKGTVTNLVRKFSSLLESPAVKCSPRRKRECCDRFRELADFWSKRSGDDD